MSAAPNALGVGAVLRTARKREGMTIKAAADKAGVSPTTWSRAEEGNDVRRDSWESINRVFGLPEGTMWNYLTIPDGPAHLARNLGIATAVVDLPGSIGSDDADAPAGGPATGGGVVGDLSLQLLVQLAAQPAKSAAEERLIHALGAFLTEKTGTSIGYTTGTRSVTATTVDPDTGEVSTHNLAAGGG